MYCGVNPHDEVLEDIAVRYERVRQWLLRCGGKINVWGTRDATNLKNWANFALSVSIDGTSKFDQRFLDSSSESSFNLKYPTQSSIC